MVKRGFGEAWQSKGLEVHSIGMETQRSGNDVHSYEAAKISWVRLWKCMAVQWLSTVLRRHGKSL